MAGSKWTGKKTIKTILSIAVAFFIMFICKGGELVNDKTENKENPDAVNNPAIIELEFWGISSEDNQNEEQILQLVNKFNSEYNPIHVNLNMQSDGYFYKIFSAAMASQTNPDVSIMFCSQAVQFFDRGFLFSLDNVVQNLVKDGHDFYPQVLGQSNLYKQYIGIPLSIENYVLLVRKDVFNKKGLKIPENMSELLEALRRVSSHNMAGIALPGKGYLSSRSLLYFVLINGGAIFDQNGNIQLSSEKNNEVYKFFNTLAAENLIYNEKSQISLNDVSNLFVRGEAAAILTTPTALKGIYDETGKDFIENIEILSLRGFDDTFYCSGPVYTELLSVFKNSQRKEEALIFAEWFCKNYSELWSQEKAVEIPSMIMEHDAAILNEKFTNMVFQEAIPNTRYPSYPNTNSVNYIAMEGTDVLNSFMNELQKSADLNGLIVKYQSEFDEWSQKFNR